MIETKYRGIFVDSLGNVYGKRGNKMSPSKDRNGYMNVCISHDGKSSTVQVHRLIMESFYKRENMHELMVNHIDGVKHNNIISNLEWCTRSQNALHSFKNGLQSRVTNQHGTYGVVQENDIITIKEMIDSNPTSEIASVVGFSERTVRKYKNKIRNGEI